MFHFNQKSAIISAVLVFTLFTISVSAMAFDDYNQTGQKVASASEITYSYLPGDQVLVNTYGQTLNLRDKPCGQKIGEVGSRSIGVLEKDVQNGEKSKCFGSTWTWLKIDFGKQKGFVAGEFLARVNIVVSSPTSDKYMVNTKILPLQIRDKPCGNRVALAFSGSIGELQADSGNFSKASCNGNTWTWIKLKFGNQSGWAASEWTQKL